MVRIFIITNVENLKLLVDLLGLEFGKENIRLVLSSWRYSQDLKGTVVRYSL